MLDNLKKVFNEIFKIKGGEAKGGEDKLITNKGEKLKEKKSLNSSFLTNLLIIFLVGVLLVIVGSMFTKDDSSKGNANGITAVANVDNTETKDTLNTTSAAVDRAYKEKMEKELVSILEQIEGVGKTTSMIYFESGQEQVPVFNQETSKSVTNEKDTSGGQRDITQENGGTTVVMKNSENNQQPFITKTYEPTITGICVVAEGAGDTVTELRIRQAVTKLFGLQDDKVQVYPMKK
ncbi:stage III sporulation protein AG [Clostridium sp.]|uniref:stage III sporulation protein AG n=1 Tax=Clostridium sp. TaxID=1506 RepID=UPI0032177BFB